MAFQCAAAASELKISSSILCRKPFAAPRAPCCNHIAPPDSGHTGAKPVPALAHKLAWLICPLHRAAPISIKLPDGAPAGPELSGAAKTDDYATQTKTFLSAHEIGEKVSPMPENWLLIGATAKPSQFGEMAERPPTAPQKSVKSRPVFPESPLADAMHKNCATGAEFWHFGAGKLPRQPHGYGSSGRRKRDKPEQGDVSSQRHLTLDPCFAACLDAKPVPAFAGHTIAADLAH
jgi:hypothetical protein